MFNPWSQLVQHWLLVEETARILGILPQVEQLTFGPKIMAIALERAHSMQ